MSEQPEVAQRGMTLLEMAFAVAILAVVAVGAFAGLEAIARSAEVGSARVDGLATADRLLWELAEDIREGTSSQDVGRHEVQRYTTQDIGHDAYYFVKRRMRPTAADPEILLPPYGYSPLATGDPDADPVAVPIFPPAAFPSADFEWVCYYLDQTTAVVDGANWTPGLLRRLSTWDPAADATADTSWGFPGRVVTLRIEPPSTTNGGMVTVTLVVLTARASLPPATLKDRVDYLLGEGDYAEGATSARARPIPAQEDYSPAPPDIYLLVKRTARIRPRNYF
ncbi:MAG: prepilin-type N-terminal cleavage/methylation domain-containing protein [Planctomycetes bacterium]|nr:prepilin-type N-terminal cleavage/methylation domain-containing protein [Planctomycetota bacterium]